MVKIQVPEGFHPDLSPHFPPGWSRFSSNLLKMLASIFEADGYPLVLVLKLGQKEVLFRNLGDDGSRGRL